MFVKDYGTYKGRKRPIKDLSPNSKYKVKVKCPSCSVTRPVTFLSISRAGHHKCRSCSNKEKNTIPIPEGSVFGKLTVIKQSDNARKVHCICKCGNETENFKHLLKSGSTRSCGCLKKKNFKEVPRAVGERHWNWQGGISGERHRTMQTKDYKDWRTAVFERDGYNCLKCNQWGGKLNAHHIESYESSEHNRLCTDNGATLCEDCHRDFHRNYGRIKTNRQMFDSYINTEKNLTACK